MSPSVIIGICVAIFTGLTCACSFGCGRALRRYARGQNRTFDWKLVAWTTWRYGVPTAAIALTPCGIIALKYGPLTMIWPVLASLTLLAPALIATFTFQYLARHAARPTLN